MKVTPYTGQYSGRNGFYYSYQLYMGFVISMLFDCYNKEKEEEILEVSFYKKIDENGNEKIIFNDKNSSFSLNEEEMLP